MRPTCRDKWDSGNDLVPTAGNRGPHTGGAAASSGTTTRVGGRGAAGLPVAGRRLRNGVTNDHTLAWRCGSPPCYHNVTKAVRQAPPPPLPLPSQRSPPNNEEHPHWQATPRARA